MRQKNVSSDVFMDLCVTNSNFCYMLFCIQKMYRTNETLIFFFVVEGTNETLMLFFLKYILVYINIFFPICLIFLFDVINKKKIVTSIIIFHIHTQN